ncbi:hypothetical protein SynA15127_01050 [Synechococcus sp. A15-127]|nr:hypothetical protein SynA15127_01050 [Synechococcus sp. A15-127]
MNDKLLIAIGVRAHCQGKRSESLRLISDGVPPTDSASQLTV